MIIREQSKDEKDITICGACEALGVSRSGYYKWLKREENGKESQDLEEEKELVQEIHSIALEFIRYGYRRITKELQRRGYYINHKKVLRIMREENILCKRRKKGPKTTDSEVDGPKYPNNARYMKIERPNQLWVSDITYVPLNNEFVYLAIIIDVFSRKCIGWALSRQINAKLTQKALNRAMEQRKEMGIEDLTHHSDRGVQYTAEEYIKKLRENGIKVSMSRRGNPYDNAFAESFMSTIKKEEIRIKEYKSFEGAKRSIGGYIEEMYNNKRIHSSIGYLTPNEFEQQINLSRVA